MKTTASSLHPINHPDKIATYFRMEIGTLLVVTVTGIIYNIGLLAGPWFEGHLAQCLFDILTGKKMFSDMLVLAGLYIVITAAVQFARYVKRLYVRRFANNINRSMKHVIYGNLVHKSTSEIETENIGSIMTKAIFDVDACAEGMRKFTTEVFDTGVALIGYICLLLWYDFRLALLSLIFPPLSYYLAEKMKVIVQKSNAAYKESSGRLSAATLDRVSGAVTYRVFGSEKKRDEDYEAHLASYEKEAVKANIWVAAMPPLYQVISMISVLFILYFGSRNVTGNGFCQWDIAAFTTFLTCFTKLSVKSSKAAKLFNSVQKAEVSWARIKPLMKAVAEEETPFTANPAVLSVSDLGFAYPDAAPLFTGISFTALPGQIIGVTGPIACGKSSLGKTFLCEQSYLGSIRFGEKELSLLSPSERQGIVGYMGHAPELLSDSIKNNILLGKEEDAAPYLKTVCIEKEVSEMPEGTDTVIGNGGIRLSGGQQARLALARTLCHRKPLIILDDPFSALDRSTEKEIFENLKQLASDSIVILISHRLYLFSELDQVIWLENGKAAVSTHQALMSDNPQYANLYQTQVSQNHEEGR